LINLTCEYIPKIVLFPEILGLTLALVNYFIADDKENEADIS
jgi:hypothetical protein